VTRCCSFLFIAAREWKRIKEDKGVAYEGRVVRNKTSIFERTRYPSGYVVSKRPKTEHYISGQPGAFKHSFGWIREIRLHRFRPLSSLTSTTVFAWMSCGASRCFEKRRFGNGTMPGQGIPSCRSMQSNARIALSTSLITFTVLRLLMNMHLFSCFSVRAHWNIFRNWDWHCWKLVNYFRFCKERFMICRYFSTLNGCSIKAFGLQLSKCLKNFHPKIANIFQMSLSKNCQH